jgi:peptidoglycan/LPS O-acetylase OafA/YrhL
MAYTAKTVHYLATHYDVSFSPIRPSSRLAIFGVRSYDIYAIHCPHIMVAVACGIKQGKDNGPATLSGLLTICFSHLRCRLAAPISRYCDMPVAVDASGKVETIHNTLFCRAFSGTSSCFPYNT